MVEEPEQVDALVLADDRAQVVRIVAQVVVGAGGRQAAIVEADAGTGRRDAAFVGRRLDVEDSAGRQRHAIDLRGRGRAGEAIGQPRELAPDRIVGAIVEIGVVLEGRPGEQRPHVARTRVEPVAGEQGIAIIVGAEQRDVRAALVEGMPGLERALELHLTRIVGEAELALDRNALQIALEHGVDHARHRVRAVDRGRAVQQHLYPAHACNRDRIGVDALHRHQILGLRAGMEHHAATVQQHQRIAGAERAQVDGRRVAARIVDAAGVATLVEGNVADLRDRSEQVVAAGRAGRLDIVLAQDRHRQDIGHVGALDLGADDDDFLLDIGRGRRLLGECRARGDQRHTRQQQSGRSLHHISHSPFSAGNRAPLTRYELVAGRRRPSLPCAEKHHQE